VIRQLLSSRPRRLAAVLAAPVLAAGALAVAPVGPATPAAVRSAATQPGGVLVLYDSSGGGYEGEEDGLALANLLGHFRLPVRREPVTSYAKGQLAQAKAAFYIGSTSQEQESYPVGSPSRAAYRAFLADAATNRATPLVWMGLNLDALQSAMGPKAFSDRFGISFVKQDTGYNRVIYKGVELTKGVIAAGPGDDLRGCTAEADGKQDCDPGLGLVRVTDPGRATVFAQASSSANAGRTAPYATRATNLWYVGDLPFSFAYDSGEDRYLALADLLHDMLGIDHGENHRALVRLEDVDARADVARLEANGAVLARHGAPFGVAAIPFHRDPQKEPGAEQGLAGSAVGATLARFVRDDHAWIVQHGTTHQWEGGPNPDTGSSGPDFEFYRVTRKADRSLDFIGPLPGDSAQWAKDRMQRGRAELEKAGIPAFAWEAPHYLASAVDYKAIAEMYPVQWARGSYFGSSPDGSEIVSQWFPYEVKDVYGATMLPEDLGFMKPNTNDGRPAVMPADLVRVAGKIRVVRDGFASFFFHPYLDPGLLDETLTGIERLGYRFVSGCSAAATC